MAAGRATSSKDQWEADASLLDDIEGMDVDTVVEAVDKGFHFMDLIKFFPNTVETMLDYVHISTGLPWWLTIVVCTAAARVGMLPLIFYAKKKSKLLAAITPKLKEYQELYAMYHSAGDKVRAMETYKNVSALYKEHNVRPFMMMLPMIGQGVLFTSFFFCIKGMTTASIPLLGLTTEGVLWFTNLTLPDCYWVLPIINFANVTGALTVSMLGLAS